MKPRLLQLIVLMAGCLGLFFICYPDCLAVFNKSECEQLHYRAAEFPTQMTVPVIKDTSRTTAMADTMLLAI